MSDAAPKPWVKALRIKSTPWRVLVGLWGHGSYKADGPAFVWVNRRKLADEIGLPLETCKNGLRALAALGWVRRRGGGWDLAWMEPEAFARSAEDTTRATGDTVRPRHDPGHGEHDPVRPRHGTRATGDTHNVVGNFQLPSNQVDDDAGARPDTTSQRTARTTGQDREPDDGATALTQARPERDTPWSPAPSPGGQLAVTGKPRRRSGDPGARGPEDHGRPMAGVPGEVAQGPGHDPGGVRGHRGRGDCAGERLSQELVKAVAAAGDAWSVRLGEVRFEQDVRACVDDIGLTPEELTRALKAWDTWDRAERPNRREVLWGRAASRAWVRKAARIGVSLYAVPAPAIDDDPWAVGS